MISETEILDQLQSGIDFPPLTIRLNRIYPSGPDRGLDALLEIRADEQSFEFAVEVSARNTPRAFDEALRRLQQMPTGNYFPMLVVPYLREKQLEQLQQRQLSGIDLSGNGCSATISSPL